MRTVSITLWMSLPLIKEYGDHDNDNADKASDYPNHNRVCRIRLIVWRNLNRPFQNTIIHVLLNLQIAFHMLRKHESKLINILTKSFFHYILSFEFHYHVN